MPRLLLFAACEQIITDLNNTVSLMKLIQEVTVQVPAGVSLPSNAGSPMQWTVIAIFEQEPGDNTRKFEQYGALMSSSGQILFQTPISLFELKAEQHRVIMQIAGMPVGNVGKFHMKCFIREKGVAQWKECGDYPIRIKWASSLIATPN